MTCDRCGGPLDPTVAHIQHESGCWGIGWGGHCDCPEVCAVCCTDPDCPAAETTTTGTLPPEPQP